MEKKTETSTMGLYLGFRLRAEGLGMEEKMETTIMRYLAGQPAHVACRCQLVSA